MNAGEVVEASLKAILVGAADASPEADEYADFLEAMNNYMAEREIDGIILGYTPVSNVNDPITIPDGALAGLVANMAVEVSADYDADVPASLARRADRGLKVMRRIAKPRSAGTRYHPTLPMGSGNWCDGDSPQFYGYGVSGVMTMTDNALATVISSADTKYRVNGYWTPGETKGMQALIVGRIQPVDTKQYSITGTVRVKATGSGTYKFHLMRVDEVVATAQATLSATAVETLFQGTTTLRADDYLELHVECVGDTENCTITQAEMGVS